MKWILLFAAISSNDGTDFERLGTFDTKAACEQAGKDIRGELNVGLPGGSQFRWTCYQAYWD